MHSMAVQQKDEPVSDGRIRAHLFRILARTQLCSIATVGRGNRAHINTAYFAYSTGLELYFLSDPESLHCQNLLANPSLAMTVFDSSQRWERAGQGVQLFGAGRRTEGRQVDLAAKVYGARFPAFGRWLKNQTAQGRRQAALLRSYAFFQFLPDRVKILDETEFGGAVFVISKVERERTARGSGRVRFRWQRTEAFVPD